MSAQRVSPRAIPAAEAPFRLIVEHLQEAVWLADCEPLLATTCTLKFGCATPLFTVTVTELPFGTSVMPASVVLKTKLFAAGEKFCATAETTIELPTGTLVEGVATRLTDACD